MLGPPSTELIAGLEALVVAGLLLGLGYLVADLCAGTRDIDEATRWGLALFGLCGFAFVMMLVHLATRGWLYSHPAVVLWTVVAIVGALGFRRVRKRQERDRSHLWIAGMLVVAAVLIWGSPIVRMMPLTATPDTQLHNGWINQLLSGDPMFSAALTGEVPNYYPWMFHSVGAIATALTPGGTPYHALAPLQVVQVAGSVLALFALGRALTNRAMTGFGAALLGALSGGFGFVLVDGLDVVTDPRAGDGAAALIYQGDLLFSRSYNVGFHNLAPPFPRDLAFGLLISFVALLALRARSMSAWTEIAAGCCLGFVGLAGGETFIVGVVLATTLALFDSGSRLSSLARMLGPGLLIYAVWFVPVIANYFDLGGFVSITHIIPVALPATAVLVSWGLTTPLALAGAVTHVRRIGTDRGVRLCVLFVVVAAVMLGVSALIPGLLGEAFETLGRKHRYWPILYLAVALLGALGLTHVMSTLRARSRPVAIGALAVATAVAWASPVIASIALPSNIGRYPGIGEAMRQEPDSLLHELSLRGPGCEVAAPREVAREVFSFTGFRLLLWTGSWLGENRARIRWTDIYEVIGSEEARIADNRALMSPGTDPETWRSIAEDRGLDLVVVPGDLVGGPALAGLEVTPTHYEGASFGIVKLRDCEV